MEWRDKSIFADMHGIICTIKHFVKMKSKGQQVKKDGGQITAAQITTQTSSLRSRADSLFLRELHFPLGSVDLEGQLSACLRPPWTAVFLFWFELTQNLKIPHLLSGTSYGAFHIARPTLWL